MPGSVYVPGMQVITKVTIAVNVVSIGLIALVFWTGCRNHKKRAAERAAAAAATTSAADGDGGEA